MSHWISRLRLQKARIDMREAGRSLQQNGAQQGWRHPRSYLALAFLAGFSVLLLRHGHQPPSTGMDLLALLGDAFWIVITLMIGSTFLRALTSPAFRARHQTILLLVILGILTLIPIRLLPLAVHLWPALQVHDSLVFLYPLGLPALLAVLLATPAAALVLGLWTACAATLLTGGSATVLLFGLLQTGMIVSLTRRVRRRTQLLKIGLLTGLSLIYGAVALQIVSEAPPSVLLLHALFGLANGLLTALAAVLLLPLLESVFGLSSSITLSDLADLGHPLLQRLAIEAPGTYHHCLVAANLAQAGAQAIGANDLLAQVGAYYHDIGKLGKAGLYTENIQAQENPHDDLSPNMSALLITAHVKEGLSLGLLGKLPPAVTDIIQQHHGTSLVAFFHHKARVQNEAEKKRDGRPGLPSAPPINENDFRYPGPKPQTREAAIVMFADGLEAASRSLAKPTPAHIQDLVGDLIRGKIVDGQLDECGLTLAEIHRLREAFIFTLTSMFHSRIAYPKDEARPAQPPAN